MRFKLIIIAIILLIILPAAAFANHIIGFYADKNGYWSGGVKYYLHGNSDVQFNVEDNGGDGLSLINGGIVVYRTDQNGAELIAIQCNWEELQNPDGICNNYDIAQNGKLAWSWDQKYYTGNQKKDDANNDGLNDVVPAGKYYGIIITVPHKNYAAGTTQYQTQTFVLDADDDGDTIPNGADICPQTNGGGKGNALGCPDADNDGVQDEKDKCVDKAETQNGYLDEDGCPDELFAGGPAQGRFTCSAEECKQIQLKNEARRDGQTGIVMQAAATLVGIGDKASERPGGISKLWPIAFALEVVEDYKIVQKTKKLVEDPPDPNYKVSVKLKQTQINFLNETDEQTKIINELFLAGRDYADTVDAFIAANEKYMGAKEAGDDYWIQLHTAERREFAKLTATKLKEFNDVLHEVEVFILQNNVNEVITKEQLINFQNELRLRGVAALPPEEVEMLKNNLGGTDEDIQNLVDSILSINQNEWADEPFSVKTKLHFDANQNLIAMFNDIGNDSGQNLFLTNIFITLTIIIVVLAVIKYARCRNAK